METDRLRYFQLITETGSLTKAAELLGISHSGLSKAMTVLESELGFKLFRPQGRGLVVTQEGLEIYKRSRNILEEIDQLKKLNKNKNAEFLRIGISEVLAVFCIQFFTEEYSGELAVLQGDLGEIEEKIFQREIDFGIIFTVSPRKEIEHLNLGKIEFNAYSRADLLTKFKDLEVPFIVPASYFPGNPLGFKVRDGWPESVTRKIHYRVSNFSLALNLLQKGKGACYMPDFIAREINKEITDENLKLKKVKFFRDASTYREIFLVKLIDQPENNLMKKFAKIIRSKL